MFVGSVTQARKPEGYRQQAVTTAAALANIPPAATYALIFVEDQGVRTRDDGTAPTTTVGMAYAAGAVIELNSRRQINAFRVISLTGTAELNISFYSADKKAYA